jgi:hypothetical protein
MIEIWQALTSGQQTIVLISVLIVVVAVIVAGFAILYSYTARGSDFSGFGDWIKSWFD